MKRNYDHLVNAFIADWERDDDPLVHTLKMASTGLILPFVYKSIREEILFEKPIPLRGSGLPLSDKIVNNLTHFSLYFLWTIKWFYFIAIRKHSQKIVLTCFFQKSRIIRDQLKLLNLPSDYFINIGLVYDSHLLFDPRFFCYPYAVYKKEYPTPSLNKIIDHFNQVFRNHFKIDFAFRKQLIYFLNNLNTIDINFRDLLNRICIRYSCVCLFQDCDYLAERVLFTHICNQKAIPTIVTDHSVLLYKHLFRECHSKYALVWGEHQLQRIRKYSSKQPNKIIIVGKPGLKYSYNNRLTKTQNWIYFLPAFQDAHMQSFFRRLDDSLKRIKEIGEYISEFKPHIKLYIKPHPSDDITLFEIQKVLTGKSLDNLVNHCSLAFTEDSTLTAELLGYALPVVYLAGRYNYDPFGLKDSNVDFVFCGFKEPIINKLSELTKPDIEKRGKMFRYYFGVGKNNNDNLNFLTHQS